LSPSPSRLEYDRLKGTLVLSRELIDQAEGQITMMHPCRA
jgi:hypothetical protein